jgi:hypothetical protein
MRMTERRDADPREQVEILLALGVEQADALAAHEANRVAPVGLQDVLGLEGLNLFKRCHSRRHDCVPTIVTMSVAASGTGPAE